MCLYGPGGCLLYVLVGKNAKLLGNNVDYGP